MPIDSSTGMPSKEPVVGDQYARHQEVAPKKPSKAPVIILSLLLMIVSFGSAYLFATAETGICADKISQAKNIMNLTLVDTKSFDQGYAKGIADTQNATIMLGYCAAQEEFLRSGALLQNNTVILAPVSVFKPACFR